jgi:hypothetical protein
VLRYICLNLKASRSNLGPISPNNPTPSSLMTSVIASSSLSKSTLKVRRALSTSRLTLVPKNLGLFFLTRLNFGSLYLEIFLSTVRLNQITTSSYTMITEYLKNGTANGISMPLLTQINLLKILVFVLELETNHRDVILIIVLESILELKISKI